MRIIGFILGFIWVGLGFIPAHAADVSFRAVWVGPTTYVDGTPGEADDYKLYVCDQPITSVFPSSPSGECAGNLQTHIITENEYDGVYESTENSGTIYARVSARKIIQVDMETVIVESDLSNEASRNFITVTALSPPTGMEIENSGPMLIIINPSQ